MKRPTRILFFVAVLTAFLCAAAYAGGSAALDARAETAFPMGASDDAETEVLVFVACYDDEGIFLSVYMSETTLDNISRIFFDQALKLPPETKAVKIMVTDDHFHPLMAMSEL